MITRGKVSSSLREARTDSITVKHAVILFSSSLVKRDSAFEIYAAKLQISVS